MRLILAFEKFDGDTAVGLAWGQRSQVDFSRAWKKSSWWFPNDNSATVGLRIKGGHCRPGQKKLLHRVMIYVHEVQTGIFISSNS